MQARLSDVNRQTFIQIFLFVVLKYLCNEILSNVFLIALRRSVTDPFLLERFNFIRYAKNETCDMMVHNNFSKIIINLESDQHIPNTIWEAK